MYIDAFCLLESGSSPGLSTDNFSLFLAAKKDFTFHFKAKSVHSPIHHSCSPTPHIKILFRILFIFDSLQKSNGRTTQHRNTAKEHKYSEEKCNIK